MTYLGDFKIGSTISCRFATVQASGAPTTLAGTPVISAYPSGTTTELTAGITLTVDYDSRTGMHNIAVVATAANGYARQTDYDLVITTGTVNSVSAVGYVVGTFSIENRYVPGLIARGTAQAATGTTLQLAASETFANSEPVGATAVITGGTGVGQARLITAYTGATDTATVDTWTTTPSGTVYYDIFATPPGSTTSPAPADVRQFGGVAGTFASGRPEVNTTHVGGTSQTARDLGASVIVASGTVTTVSGNVNGSVGSVTGAVGSVTGAVGSVTGNVGGNVVGSAASVTAGVTVTTNNDKTGYRLDATGSAALTESYAADGAAATLPQLLYMLLAVLSEFSISGTTLTAKKLDGSTTAGTFTLNDAAAPTGITRAT